MNKSTLKKITLFYLLFLTACSPTINPTRFIPISVEAGTVAIYIYRPKTMANAAYSPELYVDDAFASVIKNGQSTRLSLSPGEHVFEIASGENYAVLTSLRLNLRADNTYYLRVDTSLKIKNTATYQPYQRSFDLIHVDAALATAQMTKGCSNKETTSDHATEIEAVQKEPAQGFSVEKTQNPFSH